MPLIVQRASAGSGKTEQLARRYLRLLLVSDAAGNEVDPSTILATTFTREAAGEILARIFRLLANATLYEEVRRALADGMDFPCPTKERCQKLLRLLIEKIDRLAIGTIDALFARQARALVLDLGLAPQWKIADPLTSSDLACKAAVQLLEKNPATRSDWSMLHHFTRQRSFVEKAAVLLEAQRTLATKQPLNLASDDNSPPKYLSSAQAKEVVDFLNHFEIPLTNKGKPDGRWITSIRKLQDAFSQTVVLKDILNLSTLISKCLTHFSEQPAFNRIMIPLEFLNIFSPLAEASRVEQERLELLREQALLHLVQAYEKVREPLSFCTGSYTFAEVEMALQPSNNKLSREEIEFRMEACTEHLLLDEYQDTSERQHHFLSPLVGDVLAKGGTAFVVGDVKQGIYGWRGGKRHLLGFLEKEHEVYGVEAVALHQSYRSSQAVLAAVNEVFGALKNSEALRLMNGGEAFQTAASEWSADFQEQTGAVRVQRLRGRVQLHEVATEAEDSDGRMQDVVKKVVQLVEQHHHEDPLREIAILVRRTKFIPKILLELRRREILASGEGGNPLADTLAVEALLALLTWLDHPGHTAAYEFLKSSPLGKMLTKYFQNAGSNVLRGLLFDRGYASFLRAWTSQGSFQEACSAYELARVEQLLAMADRFDLRGGGTLSDFVKQARNERVESPLSSGVRVLTIHAAKGLEFESVILVDLDADIFAGHSEALRIQTTDEGKFFIQTNQELMARQGREKFLQTISKEQWEEALSLLYVGMTRAASYLDLVVLGDYKRRSTKSMAAWLRAVGLSGHAIEGVSWREMKASSSGKREKQFHEVGESKKSELFFQGVKKLRKRSPSQEQESGLISIAQKLQGSAARAHGVATHTRLAEIVWKNERLSSAQHQLLLRSDELASVFEEDYFLKKWSLLGVRRLEVWRERGFAVVLDRKKNGELLNGIFDRVVIGYSSNGLPIAAEIIDFKTDQISSEEKKEREKFYQPQLEAYREALQKMMPALRKIETRLIWV